MRTVTAHTRDHSYDIVIGPGARGRIGPLVESLGVGGGIVVIADAAVAKLHLAALANSIGSPHEVLRIEPGEASKSLAEAERLYAGMAKARIDRGGLVITLGGGVAGDLGGFVAATWMRGVRFIQVPTTLEAAIDASIGGKTAVNFASGKNLIGAFHQPSGVIVDTDFLQTLPDPEYVAGLAESVKHALIHDAAFLELHGRAAAAILSREPDTLSELIARNCEIKADVVSQDEREANLRMILNFGHTVGHAIEHLFEYELRHGECVALGMCAANAIAVSRGTLGREVADRTTALLDRLDLPVRLPRELNPDAVVAVCRMDKKVRDGRLRFVLLRDVAQTETVSDVTADEITGALRAIEPRA